MNIYKLLVILVISLWSLGALAQGKLFKEAISQGQQANGAYLMTNTKKKTITLEDCEDYIIPKGYFIGKTDLFEVNRYGEHMYLVNTLEFIPEKDYPLYVYFALRDKNIDFYQLKKGILYNLEWNYVSNYARSYGWKPTRITKINNSQNVLWSGNVIDGVIDGEGSGFLIGERFCYFEGTYSMGIPMTTIKCKYFDNNNKRHGDITEKKIAIDTISSATLPNLSDCLKTTDTKSKEIITKCLASNYPKEAEKLESAYKKALSVNLSNYKDFKEDGIVEEFLAIYNSDDFKYDPQKLLPKTREIQDVYYVIKALKLQFENEEYYGAGFWTLFDNLLVWYDGIEEEHRNLLAGARDLASNSQRNSDYGFKDFHAKACDVLTQKYDKFYNKIQSDREEMYRYNANRRKENREYENKYSKVIDKDRSKEPSGKLVEHGGFLSSTWYEWENEGRIQFVAGSDFAYYNIIYDEQKRVQFYRLGAISDKIRNHLRGKTEFSSYETMIDAILDAVK